MKPAVVCLLGSQCALCLWRDKGEKMAPLTVSEWVRVFRGRDD